jgi:hypothetical protein
MRPLSIVFVFLAACGATSPPVTPEVFGRGVFTTDAWDFFVAFTPAQDRAFVCRADAAFEQFTILETRRAADGTWSTPTAPVFARAWSNADPHISPDGRTVYFISNRPFPDEDAATARATYDIYLARLGADGEWGDAERLPSPVNDPSVDEWSPSVTASGDLYFGATLPGGHGKSDLWRARRTGDGYAPPENLGAAINTAADEVEPWIAPDESYLVYSALRRPDGAGGYDLFLSRRRDGAWQPARPLALGTAGGEWNQSVSPDGAWLYYTATPAPTGPGDIVRVPMTEVLR